MKLAGLAPEACFIFFGASEVVRSNSTHFPFKQNSDFHYLTEFDEADAALVMVGGKSHLFVLEKDETREIWDGERYGLDRAKTVFQVDEVHLRRDFFTKLDVLLTDAKEVYYSLGHHADRDQAILKALHGAERYRGKGRFGHLPVMDPFPLLSELRQVKDAYEIASLKKACSATAKAHLQLLKRVRAGMTEFDAFNEFQYSVFKNGCTEMGYGPIFAGGFNATTLHYVRNNELLKHGDLLLVDAGGECNGYTADLTQAFPVSSEFSPEQKTIYSAVLDVNRQLTAMVKPGISYREFHSRSVELLVDHLLRLGLLSGDSKEIIQTGAFRKYYPHGAGHYLGLDVHDAGIYHERGKDFILKAGMALTNEPGLYFRERGSPYYGIGIRIEDDLLVTETGCEILTAELPRDVDAIENLRRIANH